MVSSKASALKRLKTSLKTAGIVGPSSRASTSKKDRKKGNPKHADVTRKLDIIKQQLNPFEVKTTRLKFDVLGRRVKGSVGKPGLTKQVGEDNRKKTLLVELNRRNKAGGLVDRRFGENDPTLTPEERMLERFAHERQKRARGGLQFNLEDEDDDGEGLTHYGRSLAEIDDFEEEDLDMSDEDDKGKFMEHLLRCCTLFPPPRLTVYDWSNNGGAGTIDKHTVSRTHFGGFGDDAPPDDDGRKKSKAEVMKEVIAKSKFFKYERQKEKEEDEDLRRELDDGLEAIRDVLFAPTTSISPAAPKRPSLPSQKRVFGRAEDEAVQARGEEEEEEEEDSDALNEDDMRTLQRAEEASRADVDEKDEDYDRSVRELAFDRRARPQDRMKTEEEKAAEEKAKLEKLEWMRKRRMEGMEDEEEEEKSGKGRKRKKQRRVPQADDLEDEFLEEEAEKLGRGLTVEDIMNATEKEDVEEEKGEDKEGGEDEDWEEGNEGEDSNEEEYESDYEDLGLESGEEDDGEDEEDDGEQDDDVLDVEADQDVDENDLHPGKLVSKPSKKINPTLYKTSYGVPDLPYVFPCPRTYAEFVSLLHTHSVRPQDIPLVVHRIRTLNHPKLAPDNLAKLLPLISILLDHVVLLASSSSSSSSLFPHAALAKLARHIFELAQQMPERAAEVFLDKLKDMQAAFAMHQEVPGIKEVVVLRMLGQVFPTSDFKHPVVTPAMLFIGQCLEQGKVATEKDVARKVALAQVLYEYQSLSKRFLPEPLNFLLSVLVLLAPYPAFSSLSSVPGAFPLPDSPSSLRLERPELEPLPLDAAALLGDEKDYDRQQSRASLLWACACTVGSYAAMYASTTAFVEVFEPAVEVIKGVRVAGAGKWCKKDQLASLEATLTRQIGFAQDHRRKSPLQLQAHKPVPIATFVPKFEEGYSIDRHYDPDASRAQLTKLKHQYKRERKGAIRELRKDSMFVARERAKQRSDKDQQYKKMVTGVMTVLEGEQAEKKRLEREKAKEKRR
ncbi:nucleolar protein 14 [Endogone sp. FLAS-F59071]|nr:nucleolar protein 14 [Endogone sp. FLAS-F59071]|eukprot:RUS21119.1 nucleolar protein 14 [Endogone sp. FLAS-F59071]